MRRPQDGNEADGSALIDSRFLSQRTMTEESQPRLSPLSALIFSSRWLQPGIASTDRVMLPSPQVAKAKH